MSAHTPGPWVCHFSAEDGSFGALRVESEHQHGEVNDGWAVAEVHPGCDAEANARLIAAAPDLLVALELAEEWMSSNPPADGWGLLDKRADGERHDALAAARAAIAKARGTP